MEELDILKAILAVFKSILGHLRRLGGRLGLFLTPFEPSWWHFGPSPLVCRGAGAR